MGLSERAYTSAFDNNSSKVGGRAMNETSPLEEAQLKLQPHEAVLNCQWLMVNGRVRGDATCKRIEWLIAHHPKKIKTASGGWKTLFIDPDDGRYWEQTYPQSEMQGGGPPRLWNISAEQAKTKYQL
jgi:hypothetical protein